MPDSIYFWFEVGSLLTCILCFGKFTLTRYKLFLPYLAIIVLYEYGAMHKWFGSNSSKSNHWLVNYVFILEFVFYSFFIIAAYRDKKYKRIFTVIVLSTLAFTFIDIFFIQGIMHLCSIAIVLQYGLLIVMVCRFFYQLMHSFDKDTSLLRQPDFWVNTGLLFFFLAEFLFFAAFNLAYIYPTSFSALFHLVGGVANLILYSCLVISFLCFRQTKKVY